MAEKEIGVQNPDVAAGVSPHTSSVAKAKEQKSSLQSQANKCDNPSRWIFATNEAINESSFVSPNFADMSDRQYRQQAANMIQDISKSLAIQPIAVNTAIVYMHRFFVFHSFDAFDRFLVAACCVFLACKVEEQPRKLEHVILMFCKWRKLPEKAVKGEEQRKLIQDFIMHEQLLVETLGFDVRVEHPHSSVIKITEKIKASKDLAQTSYMLATNTLHLTTFCLQYTPVVIACVCINLACKWGHWLIPKSNERREWWQYFAPAGFTQKKLDLLTDELVTIIDQSPAKMKEHLKRKCLSSKLSGSSQSQRETAPSSSSAPSRKGQTALKSDVKEVSSSTGNVKEESTDKSYIDESASPVASSVKGAPSSISSNEVQTTVKSPSSQSVTGSVESGTPNGEQKKKQLSLSQYKERLTSLKKSSSDLSDSIVSAAAAEMQFPAGNIDKVSASERPVAEKTDQNIKTSNSPVPETKNLTIKPPIANIKLEADLTVNIPSKTKTSRSEAVSPGAESIAKLLSFNMASSVISCKPQSGPVIKQEAISEDITISSSQGDPAPNADGLDSSLVINNLLMAATSAVTTTSHTTTYSILSSDNLKHAKKHKSKEREKKKKSKHSKSASKSDRHKDERKRQRENSQPPDIMEAKPIRSEEEGTGLKIKLRLSPCIDKATIEPPPPPPLPTIQLPQATDTTDGSMLLEDTEELGSEVKQEPVVWKVHENTAQPQNFTTSSSIPPLPTASNGAPTAFSTSNISTAATAVINTNRHLPGSLGSLLESRRSEMSSGDDDHSSSANRSGKKEEKRKKKKKNKKRDRDSSEDNRNEMRPEDGRENGGADERTGTGENKHKKHKKHKSSKSTSSASSRESRKRDWDSPSSYQVSSMNNISHGAALEPNDLSDTRHRCHIVEPCAAESNTPGGGSLKLKIKLSNNLITSSYIEDTDEYVKHSSGSGFDRGNNRNLDSYEDATDSNVEERQPFGSYQTKKHKSLLSDLPMPPLPPN
ncbi:uncharacterized protein LOC142336104 [Convolutriloba macropyga]|uniref:uncharacterized protein LOC142336104 n=1 Tax=Convolutriloba macropyga TaxID=536237 RepID=UPI003F525FF7